MKKLLTLLVLTGCGGIERTPEMNEWVNDTRAVIILSRYGFSDVDLRRRNVESKMCYDAPDTIGHLFWATYEKEPVWGFICCQYVSPYECDWEWWGR